MVAKSRDNGFHGIFIPGEEPGPFAAGVEQHPEGLDRLAAYKLRMKQIPAGGDVAEVFPWWRKVSETIAAGDKIALLRPGWPATFFNNSDHIVEVDEIRFRQETTRTSVNQTGIRCKIGIPPRREIFADWIPINSLNTATDRYFVANVDSFSYELPSPYVLQRGNLFTLDMRYNAAYFSNVTPDNWCIMVGLHGWGLVDEEPISLMKPVQGWPSESPAAGQWQIVAFDEFQGHPMRDAVISHLSFGASLTTNYNGILQALEFRPHAPEGLEWTQGEWYRIDDVAEQVGEPLLFGAYVVHRPYVPYVLLPGEGMLVELWNTTGDELDCDVVLRGTQRPKGR